MTTDSKGMTEVATTNELHKLSDLDMAVADRSQDIRGRKVVDSSGEEIGEVEDLFVDDRERKVRFLQVASGGFLGIGETKFMIPVDAIKRIDEGTVHVDQTRARLAKAPKYDPDLVMKQTHWNDLYGYYGYAPFWGPGYIYPPYPFYR